MAIDMDTVREMAFALGGVEEDAHFHLRSLKVNNRIFATLWEKEQRVMVKLSLTDQSVFNVYDAETFFPVPNKWGQQGCTFIELARVRPDMLQDALTLAYDIAAAKSRKKK